MRIGWSRCVAVIGLVIPLVFAGATQADFNTNDLEGVYAFYSDDNRQVSTLGMVEFDGLENVTGGTVTILYLATNPDGPGNVVRTLDFIIVPGEGSFYSIAADGTGLIETEVETPLGLQVLSFTFISTRVNDNGKVTMARTTALQPSLAPAFPDSEVDPGLITGFIERLPLRKLRTLPEPTN
jgi:hypothetical protein